MEKRLLGLSKIAKGCSFGIYKICSLFFDIFRDLETRIENFNALV